MLYLLHPAEDSHFCVSILCDTPSSHQLPRVYVETGVESHSFVLSQLVGAILKVDRFVCWHLGPVTKGDARDLGGLISRILKGGTQELSSTIRKLSGPLQLAKSNLQRKGFHFPQHFLRGTSKFIGWYLGENFLTLVVETSFSIWLESCILKMLMLPS